MELPQLVDPMECLKQQRVFEGAINSDRLPCLSEQLTGDMVQIPYKLTFEQDAKGYCVVNCSITTCLDVVCQRCGGSMELSVSIASQLCVISVAQLEEKLPKGYEPLLAQEGMISPVDLIEEELLLAIPMIPRHDIADCPVNLSNDLLN
jgi:uncharacterized protein